MCLLSTDGPCLDLSRCTCFDKDIRQYLFFFLHIARLHLADGSLPVLLPELVLLHAAHLGHDRCTRWVLKWSLLTPAQGA